MWISKTEYENMKRKLQESKILLEKFKEDSGIGEIEKLSLLAEKAGINKHSEEFQTLMTRAFMEIGGRTSTVLKGYSMTTFVKDNPEEVLKRVQALKSELNIITKQLPHKK